MSTNPVNASVPEWFQLAYALTMMVAKRFCASMELATLVGHTPLRAVEVLENISIAPQPDKIIEEALRQMQENPNRLAYAFGVGNISMERGQPLRVETLARAYDQFAKCPADKDVKLLAGAHWVISGARELMGHCERRYVASLKLGRHARPLPQVRLLGGEKRSTTPDILL